MFASSHQRVPRARIDPIVDADAAMSVFHLVLTRPARPETVVMFLDGACRGTSLVIVHGGEQIVDVVEAMSISAAASVEIAGLVVASVRPDRGPDADDEFTWLAAADVAGDHGLILIDWLIVCADGVHNPRQQLGLRSLWPSAR